MKKALLAMMLAACVGSAAQASITVTSTAPGSGAGGYIGNTPFPITSNPWDFAGTDYMSLTSIDQITVTLTLKDGDSASGDFDHNDLELVLDNIETGLLLNGFANNQKKTLTITGPNNAAALLNALQLDGELQGSIKDLDGGYNWIKVLAYDTTLKLTGEGTGAAPVPAPGAVFLGAMGTGIVGWFRRRRSI